MVINLGQEYQKKKTKKDTYETVYAICKGRELTLNGFKSGIFPINITKTEGTRDEGLTILTPKQVCRRLPIALAQVKAGSTSENLPNEIRKIINSLYRAKEIT